MSPSPALAQNYIDIKRVKTEEIGQAQELLRQVIKEASTIDNSLARIILDIGEAGRKGSSVTAYDQRTIANIQLHVKNLRERIPLMIAAQNKVVLNLQYATIKR
jgi:hypothetical protein